MIVDLVANVCVLECDDSMSTCTEQYLFRRTTNLKTNVMQQLRALLCSNILTTFVIYTKYTFYTRILGIMHIHPLLLLLLNYTGIC